MTDDLHDTDPEADLLFGYPARRSHRCPGCLMTAEPYDGPLCWCCWAKNDAAQRQVKGTEPVAR